MCTHSDTTEIEIVQKIKVDRCIAEEIKWLNAQGVRTEGCCCGHGNGVPEAMIKPSSVSKAKELGYNPVYHPDIGLFEIILKSSRTRNCSDLSEGDDIDDHGMCSN